MTPPAPWQWPHPQSWREVYAESMDLLPGQGGLAYLLDWLKGTLP